MVRSLSCPKPGPILPRIPAVPNSRRGAIIRCSSGKAACSASCDTICRVSLFSSQANQSSTRRCNGRFVHALRIWEARKVSILCPLNASNEGHTAVYLRTIFARDNTKITTESTKVGISQRRGTLCLLSAARDCISVQRTSVQSLLCTLHSTRPL